MFYSLNGYTAVDYEDGGEQSAFCLIRRGSPGQAMLLRDVIELGLEIMM